MDKAGKRWLALAIVCSIVMVMYLGSSSRMTQKMSDLPPFLVSRIKSGITNVFKEKEDTHATTSPIPYSVAKWKGTNRSLTVVTAFFDIGKFPKGGFSNMRGENTYKHWGSVFAYMQNPLVVYTDGDMFKELFSKLRANFTDTTKIIKISRQDLWPFQIMPQIAKLYSRPGYPKHYPNTYKPEYTSLTHAKQPVLADAVERDFFHTDYYCWFDVGYFRDIEKRKKKFWLEVPSEFDKTKIGVTRVFHVDLDNTTPQNIILGNKNWIGGGLFLGVPEVILKFHLQYKAAVMRYLKQGLMNVEQHILYAMYTKREREKYPLKVDVQLFIPGSHKVINTNPWFYLGYRMYSETVR